MPEARIPEERETKGAPSEPTTLRGERLSRFLERLASEEPAPGGGAAAAIAAAMAAALVAMVARFSGRTLGDAAALAAEADGLVRRAAALADEDAVAYRAVLSALALPKSPDPARRRAAIDAALDAASEVPLEIATVAADAARLAARLAPEGNPNLHGDAGTAAALALGAARAGALLVAENLARRPDDPRHARAAALVGETRAHAMAILGEDGAIPGEERP